MEGALSRLLMRRRFLEIDQSETKIACGSYICKWIGTKGVISIEELP
jgi:hypothetical protein